MDELHISGRRFISARRIARENGYTSDYIGQLIRGRKIIGQKVGRVWYVDAASFNTYLGGSSAVIEKLEQPDTAVAPPVAETLPPVSADTIAEKKEEEVEKPKEESRPSTVELAEKKIAEKEKEDDAAEARRVPLHVARPVYEAKDFPLYSSGLRYFADEEPNLPEIARDSNESRQRAHAAPADRLGHSEPFAPRARRRGVRGAALAALALAALVSGAYVSSRVSVNLTIEAGNSAAAYYSFDF